MIATARFQHVSAVLHLEKKKMGLFGSRDVLSPESKRVLREFGDDGWELVSIIPLHRGFFTIRVIAFLKRSA